VAELVGPPVRRTPGERLRSLYWRHLWRVSSLLYALAWVWRRLLRRTTFVAITGSHGKTTCKELTADVLAGGFPTFRSPHNVNARAGVALNVLRVRPWHRFAVLEVAVGKPGDMAAAARVVRPHVAAVLCVKGSHTVAFSGGLEQHAAEKALLLRVLCRGGVAVLNDDDLLVRGMPVPADVNVVRIGATATADIRYRPIPSRFPARASFRVRADGRDTTVRTRLVGDHWWPSVLAAIAIGRTAGIAPDGAAAAIAATEPYPGRMQPVRLPGGAIVLRDDYNASLDGSEPAFQVLAEADASRRVLVVTDVSDTEGHRQQRLRLLAERAARCADLYVVVGESAAFGARRAVDAGLPSGAAVGFATLQDAAAYLFAELRPGDVVLVKGRTTDHAGRLLWAQFGPISCWLSYCPKRQLCDTCHDLGSTAALNDPLPSPPQPPED